MKPAEFGFKAEEAKPRIDPQWEERQLTADVGSGHPAPEVIFDTWIA